MRILWHFMMSRYENFTFRFFFAGYSKIKKSKLTPFLDYE